MTARDDEICVFTVRTTLDLHNRIVARAAIRGMGTSDYMAKAVEFVVCGEEQDEVTRYKAARNALDHIRELGKQVNGGASVNDPHVHSPEEMDIAREERVEAVRVQLPDGTFANVMVRK